METKKKKYVPPLIEVIEVETEQGIAATSRAIVTPTGQSNFQPDVVDWQEESQTQTDYL